MIVAVCDFLSADAAPFSIAETSCTLYHLTGTITLATCSLLLLLDDELSFRENVIVICMFFHGCIFLLFFDRRAFNARRK